MLSYIISAVGDVVMAWALYVLLQPINRALAMLRSVLQLVYAAAWLAALSNLGLIYRLIAVPAYARHTSAAGLPSQIAGLLGAYHSGWGLSLILFGLHLVVTGWLIARSSYLPRWIGWLLFVAGWAWVVNSVSIYLFPEANLPFLKGDLRCGTDLYGLAARVGMAPTGARVPDQGAAMTQRAEGKLAGYAYLAYIVFAMSAAILSGKTTAGADTSHMLSTLRSTIAHRSGHRPSRPAADCLRRRVGRDLVPALPEG